MSHFSRIRTELADIGLLKKSLEDLGYKIEEHAKVRGFGGQLTKAEIVVRMPNGYDLGFRKSGDTLELVADLWGLAVDKDEFLETVKQRYARNAVINQATQEGFQIVKEETLDDGSIRIVCERNVEERVQAI
jgi:hypothetical protein